MRDYCFRTWITAIKYLAQLPVKSSKNNLLQKKSVLLICNASYDSSRQVVFLKYNTLHVYVYKYSLAMSFNL